MKNLILFILKHNFFFLFLIFEGLSITLYIQNNYYQQAQFFNFSNEVSGSILNTRNNITQYFGLKKVNKVLAESNAKLLGLSIKSFTKIDTTTFLIKDTLYKQQFRFMSAKVINNSINKRNNYLTLNKGRKDGIEKDMAVITSNGVVGIVKNVSQNFASVISILNSKTKISGKIKKNNYVGSVLWEGMDYEVGVLKDIPSHVKIIKGDTVVTSGYSNIFPEGIAIGTVLYYKKDIGENFYTIYIKFTNDYNRINYVYVVRSLFKDEQKSLEKATQNE